MPDITSEQMPGVFAVVHQDGQLVHQTPEAIHPGHIKGNSPAAESTRQMFASYSDKLALLNTLYMRRDWKLRDELRQYRGEGFDNARRETQAEIKRHEDALAKASGFKPDPALISLVATTFAQMKPHERAGAIDKLVDEGDGRALAILADQSGIFSGLDDALKATIKDRLFAKTDPATFQAWKTAKANAAQIEKASIAMNDALAKLAKLPDLASPEPMSRSVAHGFAA